LEKLKKERAEEEEEGDRMACGISLPADTHGRKRKKKNLFFSAAADHRTQQVNNIYGVSDWLSMNILRHLIIIIYACVCCSSFPFRLLYIRKEGSGGV
jgi:hypothetical protein